MTGQSSLRHKIGIVEDDPAVIRFFQSVIESCAEFEIAFIAESVEDALSCVERRYPDLCLVDLGLPDGNGLDVIRQLKSKGECKALVTTVLGDRSTVMKVLKGGADGYIIKNSGQDDIITHVRATLKGMTPVSPQVATYLMELLHPEPSQGQVPDAQRTLTPREMEILSIFGRGLTYDETAHALGISINTVRDHVKRIYVKLQVKTRSEAMYEAQQMGLISGKS